MTIDIVVEVETADQPAKRVGATGRAQLLGESLGLGAERRLDERGGTRLGVLGLQALDFLVSGDRGDSDVAHVPVDVERSARRLRLDAPVAIVVALEGIAVRVPIPEAVGTCPQIGVVQHKVRVAVDGPSRFVRSERHALAVCIAGGRLVLPRADRGIVVGVVARQQDAGCIRRLPLQLATNRYGIALVVIGRIVVLAAAVFGPAVVLVHRGGQPPGDGVADRAAERRLRLGLVIAAVGEVHEAVDLVGRPLTDEVNHPTRRVPPEQRSLRTAQHFDALQVEELKAQSAGGGTVDVVDVHRDGVLVGVGEVVQPHAAQEEVDDARLGIWRRVDEPRRHRHDVRAVGEAELADLLVAEGSDRDTDVLEALLALLRGDDDLLETARGLRGRGAGQRGGYGDEEDGGQLMLSCHGSVPPGPA